MLGVGYQTDLDLSRTVPAEGVGRTGHANESCLASHRHDDAALVVRQLRHDAPPADLERIDGAIEVGVRGGPQLRLRNGDSGGEWHEIDVGERETWDEVVAAAIQGTVAALTAGREPELSARKALQATELIFATYESSRSRQRVDLPLEIVDSPLLAMLESGDVSTGEM